jgi:hypothetical protein
MSASFAPKNNYTYGYLFEEYAGELVGSLRRRFVALRAGFEVHHHCEEHRFSRRSGFHYFIGGGYCGGLHSRSGFHGGGRVNRIKVAKGMSFRASRQKLEPY